MSDQKQPEKKERETNIQPAASSKQEANDKEKPTFEKPKTLLAWEAPVREFEPKSPAYFGSLIVLTLFFALLLAVAFKEYILSVAVITLGFVLFSLNKVEPPSANYELMNVGIKIGKKEYRWRQLFSFHIKERDPLSVLYLETRLYYPTEITIPFPSKLKDTIEKELLDHLEYRERKKKSTVDYLNTIVEELPLNLEAPVPRAVGSFFKRLFGKGTKGKKKG